MCANKYCSKWLNRIKIIDGFKGQQRNCGKDTRISLNSITISLISISTTDPADCDTASTTLLLQLQQDVILAFFLIWFQLILMTTLLFISYSYLVRPCLACILLFQFILWIRASHGHVTIYDPDPDPDANRARNTEEATQLLIFRSTKHNAQ